MKTLSLTKAQLLERAKFDMQTHLQVPRWSLREKIALTCRILFAQGHDSGLAGQITSRGDAKGTYYTQQLGLGFDEISTGNLLLVDEDLNVLEGSGMANPANRFHTWIYRVRPDVNCIIHTHPLHVSALSMLGIPMIVSHMDSCLLFDDVAFLSEWPGVPVGNSEGEVIAGVLRDKRAALLAHHGVVVVGSNIEEACMLAIQLERTARMQLLAAGVGKIRSIDPELAREAHDWILQERRSQAGFCYYARRAIRAFQDGDVPIFE